MEGEQAKSEAHAGIYWGVSELYRGEHTYCVPLRTVGEGLGTWPQEEGGEGRVWGPGINEVRGGSKVRLDLNEERVCG